MKSPAFQFYPADWLGSQRVQLMSLEEEGAYARLICYCWIHGSIPADPNSIARLIGKGASTTLATTLATMFQAAASNRLIHDRLEAERKKQLDWRNKSSQGGKKSAEKRANKVLQNHDSNSRNEGSLKNGSNHSSTLPSISSPSGNEKTPPSFSREAGKPPRARDALKDALASVDGSNPLKITQSAWPKICRALSEIVVVTPDVTPEEINRRTSNYRLHHSDWSVTPTAIAKHWAMCEQAPRSTQGALAIPIDELSRQRRDSV